MSVEAPNIPDSGPAKAPVESFNREPRWTAEVIADLDWRRIAEIVRAMASFSGFGLGPTTLEPDAQADFTMNQLLRGTLLRFLVRLAPWNNWVATRDAIEAFSRDTALVKDMRGIYIAPLGFSPSALQAAHVAQIELVDATMLAARLNQLPEEHSHFYHEVGTAGNASTPSCPACLGRLTRAAAEERPPLDYDKLPDLSYRGSDLVAEATAARRLEVMAGCEVHFVHEVHARDIIIHGVAIGNFVCDGIILLNPGARLFGTVAARSVLVRPGAEMHGETRILQSTPKPIQSTVKEWVWKCDSETSKDACRSVCLLPH